MTTDTDTRPSSDARPRGRRWALYLIFAVLLVWGVIQTLALSADEGPMLRMDDRHLIAGGPLHDALYGRVDRGRSAPAVGEPFHRTDGVRCRTFTARSDDDGPMTGTACQIQGKWRIMELRQGAAALPPPAATPAETPAAAPAPAPTTSPTN